MFLMGIMIIRKIRRNEIVSKKKIMRFGLVLLVVLLVAKWVFSWVNKESANLATLKPSQVGETVHVQGVLSVDNNFPHYTHNIVDEKWTTVGVKSVAVNLNAYKDTKVEVVGTLESFLKSTPIVDVQSVKLPDAGLIVKNNVYYFTDQFLYIDFSTQPQLSASLSWKDIVIRFGGKPVVSIQRFLCAQILKGKDCTSLEDEYLKSQRDNFDSYRGYVFYKHGENIWTTFDGNLFGYIFKNIDDDMMLNISSMIRIVNKDFIIQNKMPIIQGKCANADEYLKTIDTSKIQYGDARNIQLMLQGESNKKHTVQCSITFDTWNEWTVNKATFTTP